ncbi:hypothetical protein [Demequina capsici]|uniref:Uncharacterized protein n=1 Tax=Demequina capsici TaxID=3075620 RepID=A0AA96F7X8_9MICO|nr:hypothetical protein [Demequina sp. OYTSA14]WNM25254.1 hypothetical protein RN606_03645 [Demequina sp. OYTSA14]
MSDSLRCPESIEVPGKPEWMWPECGWFLAQPWAEIYNTQDGTKYAWGGICKRHGEVSDGS